MKDAGTPWPTFALFWILFGIGQVLRKLGVPPYIEWTMYVAMAQLLWMDFQRRLAARTRAHERDD